MKRMIYRFKQRRAKKKVEKELIIILDFLEACSEDPRDQFLRELFRFHLVYGKFENKRLEAYEDKHRDNDDPFPVAVRKALNEALRKIHARGVMGEK